MRKASRQIAIHTGNLAAHGSTDQELEIASFDQEYSDLLHSVVSSFSCPNRMLSVEVIKTINAAAIFHPGAGQWRSCDVKVGEYNPPPFREVSGLMDSFVHEVNHAWETDPVLLATYVLWKINHIHPFENGNGRTARVVCFFVLCLKLGGLVDGEVLLPDRIRANRPEYVQALKHADETYAAGHLDLGPLHALVARLLWEQIEEKSL